MFIVALNFGVENIMKVQLNILLQVHIILFYYFYLVCFLYYFYTKCTNDLFSKCQVFNSINYYN